MLLFLQAAKLRTKKLEINQLIKVMLRMVSLKYKRKYKIERKPPSNQLQMDGEIKKNDLE